MSLKMGNGDNTGGGDDWLEGSSPFALPESTYNATVEKIEDHISQWGPSFRWIFRPLNLNPALEAPDGFTVSRITSRKVSDGPNGPSRANEIIGALIGHRLAPRESIRKSDLIGKPCRVVLGINEAGYNSVERVLPPKPPTSASGPGPKPEPDPEPVDPDAG